MSNRVRSCAQCACGAEQVSSSPKLGRTIPGLFKKRVLRQGLIPVLFMLFSQPLRLFGKPRLAKLIPLSICVYVGFFLGLTAAPGLALEQVQPVTTPATVVAHIMGNYIGRDPVAAVEAYLASINHPYCRLDTTSRLDGRHYRIGPCQKL